MNVLKEKASSLLYIIIFNNPYQSLRLIRIDFKNYDT